MKRIALTVAVLLVLSSGALARTLRIEIGADGKFSPGEWTACRISGLDNVPDGTRLTVTVSDMVVREFRVEKGAAEGPIIIPDESPTIRVDVAGVGEVRVSPEDLARLACVKDGIHRGSVRPDLYEIFGSPGWSTGARRVVAVGFCGVLMLVALGAVMRRKRSWIYWASIVVIGLVSLLSVPVWLQREHQPEKVCVFAEGESITIKSETRLEKKDLGREMLIAEDAGFVPVASYRGEWEEHPLRVDQDLRVWREPNFVPSREVMWSVRAAPMPEVRPDPASADSRTRQIREATERWWRERHPDVPYTLTWTADPPEKGVFSAGTLIAVRRAPAS